MAHSTAESTLAKGDLAINGGEVSFNAGSD